MIYHIVSHTIWQKALVAGYYEADSLTLEGFIHASKAEQVTGVLSRYYAGESNLLLLHIDETRLTAPLKFERSPSVDEDFPHIYGRLNIDAVIKIENL